MNTEHRREQPCTKRERSPLARSLRARLRAVLALLALAVGCTAPVIYARTAEVAKPGAFRLAAGVNHGYAAGSVRERVAPPADPGAPWPIEPTYRGNAADAVLGGYTPAGVLVSFLSAEGDVAVGLFRPCELGGLASMLRVGLELRCALLDELAGAPIGLALAAGGLHRSFYINADGFAFRGGLELSKRGADVTPLINAYVRYGPTMRLLKDSDMRFREGSGFGRGGGVEAQRDELVLSLPIGVALLRQHLIVAFVTEFTLEARNTQLKCLDCDGWVPTRFRQLWAIYLTIGATGTTE